MIDPCPRCGSPTELRRVAVQNSTRQGGDAACTNPNCSWPNPEPGPIGVGRLRDGADQRLQAEREAGRWPPIP